MNQPKLYSEHNELQLAHNRSVINKYMKLIKWKKAEKILEIGVGDGKSSTELLIPLFPEDFHTYVGCDLSHSMIEYANQNYNMPKVKFVQCDIQSPDAPSLFEEKFDHVFSFLCLHWVRNNKLAAINIFDMLRPGGEILCAFAERNSIDDIFWNLSQNPKWSQYGHEKHLTRYFFCDDVAKEWENCFKNAGFVDIKCFKDQKSFTFSSEESYKNFYIACNPIVKNIPYEKTAEYIDDFFQECVNGPLTTREYCDNKKEYIYKIHYTSLAFYAKKPTA